MPWKQKVAGCFGGVDKVFGSHTLDRERAREMLKEAGDEGATIAEIEQEARSYLTGEQCLPAHIDAQIVRVKDVTSYL